MVNIGDAVTISDEKRQEHVALVTAIHGWTTPEQQEIYLAEQRELADKQLSEGTIKQEFYDQWVQGLDAQSKAEFAPSCINVVYVSKESSHRDPYGRQLERLSSLQHESMVQNMTVPGRFYRT